MKPETEPGPMQLQLHELVAMSVLLKSITKEIIRRLEQKIIQDKMIVYRVTTEEQMRFHREPATEEIM
jgi:hypothetical protein